MPRRAAAEDEAKVQEKLARVRKQLQDMEKEAVAERRLARARDLLGGSSAGSLGVEDLRSKLKEVVKMDLTEAECVGLLQACRKDRSGALSLDDLGGDAFDVALEKLAAEKAEAYQRAKAAEAEEAARAEEASRLQKQVTDLFSADSSTGGDTGAANRVLACFAYLLPLTDGIQYGLPLVEFVPGLFPIFQILGPLLMLKSAIPFGTFIFLIAFQYLASNPEYPYFLRFNLQQACVMDILFILPALIKGFVGIQLPESLELATFVILSICIVYAVVLNALGKATMELADVRGGTLDGSDAAGGLQRPYGSPTEPDPASLLATPKGPVGDQFAYPAALPGFQVAAGPFEDDEPNRAPGRLHYRAGPAPPSGPSSIENASQTPFAGAIPSGSAPASFLVALAAPAPEGTVYRGALRQPTPPRHLSLAEQKMQYLLDRGNYPGL